MSKIILLSGKKEVGKSTVATYLKTKYTAIELALADSLKDTVTSVFLLDNKQTIDQQAKKDIDQRWNISPRVMMQSVGDLFRKYLPLVAPQLKLNYSIFIENTLLRINKLIHSDKCPELIIISDVRYPDEHVALKKLKNSISLKILRDTGDTDAHSSENVNIDCDYTINNNGPLDDLYTSIDKIINSI